MPATLFKLSTAPDLVEQVYKRLLDQISVGTLAPGARITQEQLAHELAVSRQPVLQALRLLKKDGFVHDAPPLVSGNGTRGRGVLVAPLDAQWTARVYQVRGALDALAARLAAQARHRIDAALIERGRKAARGRDLQAMIEADVAFHEAIYAASGNPLIAQSAQLHWRHLRRVMGAVLQQSGQREAVWDEHQAIADAIAAGEPDRAARMIEEHSTQAAANLAGHLADHLGAAPLQPIPSRPLEEAIR